MSTDILVSLLITRVLWDKVKVLSSDDKSSLHLGGHDDSSQDSSTDGDRGGSEWALLVNVGSLDGLDGGLESETDLAMPALNGTGLL